MADRTEKSLTLKNFLEFFPEEKAPQAFELFELSDQGTISKKALVKWVVTVYKERKALSLTLSDNRTVVAKLHRVLDVVCMPATHPWYMSHKFVSEHNVGYHWENPHKVWWIYAARSGRSAYNMLPNNGREHSEATGGLLFNLAPLCVCVWQRSTKHIRVSHFPLHYAPLWCGWPDPSWWKFLGCRGLFYIALTPS